MNSTPVTTLLPPAAVAGAPLDSVDTHALLLDLDAFERNLGRMQAAADAAGIGLRPHAKAHKCPQLTWQPAPLIDRRLARRPPCATKTSSPCLPPSCVA